MVNLETDKKIHSALFYFIWATCGGVPSSVLGDHMQSWESDQGLAL